MSNLVFYLHHPVLGKLSSVWWIGDTTAQVPDVQGKIDMFDFFHRPVTRDAISFLDTAIIEELWAHFFAFYDQMNRWSWNRKLPLDVAGADFAREVAGQIHLLQTLDIQTVMFDEDPHRGRDFLNFHVAKSLGLRTHIFETINLEYRTFVKQDINVNLSEAMLLPPELKRSRVDVNRLAVTILHTGADAETPSLSLLKRLLRRRVKQDQSFRARFHRRYFRHFIRPYRKNLMASVISVELFFGIALFFRRIHRRWWLKRASSGLVGPSDIVFYAHNWPERTINPRGAPFFDDQLAAVQLLVATGRRVFFREHPVSVRKDNLFRNRTPQDTAYRRALEASGVVFLRQKPTSSHIVATVNGTAGLEAALAGRKVVCFGVAWYDFLPNVHRFQNLQNLSVFLSKDLNAEALRRRDSLSEYLTDRTISGRFAEKYRENSKDELEQLGQLLLHLDRPQ